MPQGVHVTGSCTGDRHGSTRKASVSARCLLCPNSAKFQAYHFLIKHRHQPTHRTNESLTRLAPVHTLGPVERINFLRQLFGQNLGGAPPFLGYLASPEFASGGTALCQLSTVH